MSEGSVVDDENRQAISKNDERNDNICYTLAKFRCNEEVPLPSWSGFFTKLTTIVLEESLALVIFLLLMTVLQILVSLTQFFHKT